MKIIIKNYLDARKFQPTEPTLAIRVYDNPSICGELPDNGDNPENALVKSPLYVGVFAYTFADLSPYGYPEDYLDKRFMSILITQEIAQQMVEDFAANYHKATTLMVHCNAGLSRSPAVAWAMCDAFGLDMDWEEDSRTRGLLNSMKTNGYVGNQYVYDMIMKAAKSFLKK